jgi:outer membrane protein insertion porin family
VIRWSPALWLLASGLTLPALAQEAEPVGITVGAVKVQGNRRSEADAVLAAIATRADTRFDRERIRSDLKSVFQLGFYRDVQVDLAQVEGTWVVTFIVEEKPSIREVRTEGNEEIDDDELNDVLDVKAFGILDLAKVNRNAEKIKDLYTEKGYFLAEVNWQLIDLPDNQVDVVYRITEKQEVKVARIVIVGNQALSDDYILERLETRVGGFLGFMSGAGSFKQEAFDRDQLRLGQFYYDQGYIKARVGKPKVELSPDKSELYLTIPVEEGERFRTGPVDVSGDFLKPKEELMKLVTMKEGDWFSSTRLRETMEAVGNLYKDEGYAYVELVPQTMVDEAGKVVGITIDIDQGKKVRFGRIRVVGNTRTRDKVIRRQMRIYEGEYYSSAGLDRSEKLITRLGFFETVEIRTTRGESDETMDVMVEVKEKPTGTFQIGAGFSSIESFVAQAQIAQNNLFGRGQSLSLQATLSSLRTIAQIRFADDYLLDTDIQFATNIYRYETSYESFTRSSLGGDLTFGYPLSDDWSVSATYTLEDVQVDEGGFGRSSDTVRIANYFNNGLTSSMRLGLYWDTRNNRLFPSEGFYANVSVEEASQYIGSENLFTRYRARYRYYYDLGYFMVLKLNAEWGLITSPNENGPPIFERFFVGGPLSVRGFYRYSLGPTIQVPDDPTPTGASTDDLNIGGTEQMVGNAEFEFPIFQKLQIRGVLFADGGNAFDKRDDYLDKLEQFRFAWGFGIRWFSPIGPLRFEWGFPFAPREGEQSSVFDFSIGNFF